MKKLYYKIKEVICLWLFDYYEGPYFPTAEVVAPAANFESGIYNPDDGSITPIDVNSLTPEQKNYIEKMAKMIFKKKD